MVCKYGWEKRINDKIEGAQESWEMESDGLILICHPNCGRSLFVKGAIDLAAPHSQGWAL